MIKIIDITGTLLDKLNNTFKVKWLASYKELGVPASMQVGNDPGDDEILERYARKLFRRFQLYTSKELFNAWDRSIMKMQDRQLDGYARFNFALLEAGIISEINHVPNDSTLSLPLPPENTLTDDQQALNALYENPTPEFIVQKAKEWQELCRSGKDWAILGDVPKHVFAGMAGMIGVGFDDLRVEVFETWRGQCELKILKPLGDYSYTEIVEKAKLRNVELPDLVLMTRKAMINELLKSETA